MAVGKRLAAARDAWICFQDEAGQVLRPPVSKTWARRGRTPVVEISGKGSGRVSIAGLVCLGYPFHPPGRPTQLRTKHLGGLKTPALIVQGTRDEFGVPDEVKDYDLARTIEVHWVEDGDHDLKPRKSVTGIGGAEALRQIAAKVKDWAAKL